VSFAAITLCVASERVFIVVSVYFVTDSVRKLMDKPAYIIFFVLKVSNLGITFRLFEVKMVKVTGKRFTFLCTV
jgi:hypothetical protein